MTLFLADHHNNRILASTYMPLLKIQVSWSVQDGESRLSKLDPEGADGLYGTKVCVETVY